MGEGWLLRNVVKKLRRKLGDAAAEPRYIITEPRRGRGTGWGRGIRGERVRRSLEVDALIRERCRYSLACMTTLPPSMTWMFKSWPSSRHIPTRGVLSASSASICLGRPSQRTVTP